MLSRSKNSIVVAALLALTIPVAAQVITDEPPMMTTDLGWNYGALHTIGEELPSTDSRYPNGYTMPGILDGLGALQLDENTIRILANHELSDGNGYSYDLGNGTFVRGARVSYFDISRQTGLILGTGLAYNKVYDRQGNLVTDPVQINESDETEDGAFFPRSGNLGFSRFCSAQLYNSGQLGFVDDIFMTNEETSDPAFHPNGGSYWAIDVDDESIWAVPAMGRGTWEGSTPVLAAPGQVAILLGDDTSAALNGDGSIRDAAPIWLYVGQKDAIGDGSFLDRNGLAVGQLYYFVSNDGFTDPSEFKGTFNFTSGFFTPIDVQDITMAGQPGYDSEGYKDGLTLRTEARLGGALQISRPEDVHTSPFLPIRTVFATTGRSSAFPDDSWGQTLIIDINPFTLEAFAGILYDGDDAGAGQFAGPDFGIRNPDNLTWATNNRIYIQEDRAVGGFGDESGEEASIWELSPVTGIARRIAQIDRSVVEPSELGVIDDDLGEIGAWETSGIVDLTDQFGLQGLATVLLGDVQAHGIETPDGGFQVDIPECDPAINPNPSNCLDEGGQLFLMWKLD